MTRSRTADTLGDDVMWERFRALHITVERRLAQALQRHHGIGLSEYLALRDLTDSAEGELRIQDLADRIDLTQSSVSRLVDRLNSAGYAYKDQCPSDKRGIFAVITEPGRTQYEAARSTYLEVLSAALDEARGSPYTGDLVEALRRPNPRPEAGPAAFGAGRARL